MGYLCSYFLLMIKDFHNAHLWSCIKAHKPHAEVNCQSHEVALHDAGVRFTLQNRTIACYTQVLHSNRKATLVLLLLMSYETLLIFALKWLKIQSTVMSHIPVSSPPPGKWPSEKPFPRSAAHNPVPRWRTCPPHSLSGCWSSASSCPEGHCPNIRMQLQCWPCTGEPDRDKATALQFTGHCLYEHLKSVNIHRHSNDMHLFDPKVSY